MSNLRPGTEIYRNEEGDYKLMFHEDDGHVVGWNRNYWDGHPLNTWRSTDFGMPEEAALSYPGLAQKIEEVSKGAQQ
jgi:hypothetical protein